MTQFIALITGTFREAIAKKIFLGFTIISTLIILSFLFMVNLDSVDGMISMFGASGEEAVRDMVVGFQVLVLNFSYLMIITFCLIAVSSFIPSMVEKGNIDVLLSKPISRGAIILGKFAGGVVLIFISLLYLIGFVWLILSIKSGFWHVPFLYSIFWLTYSFATIYSLIILIGLISQSSVISMITGFFLVFIISPLLAVRDELFSFISNDVIKFILDFFYYILPKPGGIIDISSRIVEVAPVNSYEPAITSGLFMIAMLALSILYFRRRDY